MTQQDSNLLRPAVPDEVMGLSEALYLYLQEQAQALREFFDASRSNTVLVPIEFVQQRSRSALFALGAEASVQILPGRISRLRYARFKEPAEIGMVRFVYEAGEGAVSETGRVFVGVDATTTPIDGDYGWVITRGAVPGLTASAPTFPAFYGVVNGQLALQSAMVVASRHTPQDVVELLGYELSRDAVREGRYDVEAELALINQRITALQEITANLPGWDSDFLQNATATLSESVLKATLASQAALGASDRAQLTLDAISLRSRQLQASITETETKLAVFESQLDQVDLVAAEINASAQAARQSESQTAVYAQNAQLYATTSQTAMIAAQVASSDIQAQASVSQIASASASLAAAQAQAAVSLMSSTGTTKLTVNGGFDTWLDPAQPPTDWTIFTPDGAPSGGWSRVAGLTGGYAFNVELNPGTEQLAIDQRETPALQNLRAGWVVVELTIRMDYGTLDNLFVVLYTYNPVTEAVIDAFTVEALDMNVGGSAIGTGVPGVTYRAVAMINKTTAATHDMGLRLVMQGDPGGVAKQMVIDSFDVRDATAAEVASQTVLPQLPGQIAALDTSVNTLTTQQQAQATAITNLNSTTAGLTTSVATINTALSTLTTENSSQATSITTLTAGQATQASAIAGLNSSVVSLSGTVGAQGTAIANLQAASATYASQINTLQTADGVQASAITSLNTSVGALSASVTTQANSINGILAKYTIQVSAGGVVTGVELLGGGGVSQFTIQADKLLVKTSTTAKTPFAVSGDAVQLGTDLFLENNRIIANSGGRSLVIGAGFGDSNQFIEWFGPSMALSAMTEANAVTYRKTNGNAYFLNTGLLTTSITTTDTAANAVLETTVFGSDGRNIRVTLNYSYSSQRSTTYGNDMAGGIAFSNSYSSYGATKTAGYWNAAGNDPGDFNVQLYRRIGSGSYTLVDTLVGRGTWIYEGLDFEVANPRTSFELDSAAGTLTYIDTANTPQTRQYRAVITARNPRLQNALQQSLRINTLE